MNNNAHELIRRKTADQYFCGMDPGAGEDSTVVQVVWRPGRIEYVEPLQTKMDDARIQEITWRLARQVFGAGPYNFKRSRPGDVIDVEAKLVEPGALPPAKE